ncbi:lytic transglycosylase domain-containing protein [Vibrio vulnificus]
MILESSLMFSLASQCQNTVDPEIISRLIQTESSKRPYVVAIKGSTVAKQPETREEAISFIKQLDKMGFNYSVGLMQVNVSNFSKVGLTLDNAFDFCENIKAGAFLFNDCHVRAKQKFPNRENSYHIDAAASCYYSGNFNYGFLTEKAYGSSYVERFNKVKLDVAVNDKVSYDNNVTSNVVQIHDNDNPRKKNELKQYVEVWDVFGDFSQ